MLLKEVNSKYQTFFKMSYKEWHNTYTFWNDVTSQVIPSASGSSYDFMIIHSTFEKMRLGRFFSWI